MVFTPPEMARKRLVDLVGQAVALVASKAALPPVEDIDVVRADLRNRLTEAFQSYAGASGRGGRAYINDGKQALQEDLAGAFYAGYSDAGGEETEDDDETWLTAKQAEQQGFMDAAFDALKEARADETITEDDLNARVEHWAGTLDGVYSEGLLRGGKNFMCYFDGDDGKHSCASCQKLKNGPPRSVKWILAHNAIPSPGNPEFDCECWQCQHNWFSVKTDEQVTF